MGDLKGWDFEVWNHGQLLEEDARPGAARLHAVPGMRRGAYRCPPDFDVRWCVASASFVTAETAARRAVGGSRVVVLVTMTEAGEYARETGTMLPASSRASSVPETVRRICWEGCGDDCGVRPRTASARARPCSPALAKPRPAVATSSAAVLCSVDCSRKPPSEQGCQCNVAKDMVRSPLRIRFVSAQIADF